MTTFNLATKMLPTVFAGAAVAAFALAGPASLALAGPASLALAGPAGANPPDCVSPDGTPCGVVEDGGVTGGVPGGMSGTAGPDLVEGQIPGGPSGVVTPDNVSGCVPGIGCLNIPR